MIYNNAIYITENKLYFKKNNQLLQIIFNDDIVYKLNKKIFITKYHHFLKENKLGFFLYNKKITIIHDGYLSKYDLEYLKILFYEIGYKDVYLKSVTSIVKLDKCNSFLIMGNYDQFIYLDYYNHKKYIVFDKKVISLSEELTIIKKRLKRGNLIILGQIDNIDNIKNYYIIDNKARFFLAIST